MASNFGSGVSRVLNPDQASLVQCLWQQGKPPLDSELNLMQQLDDDWRRIIVEKSSPSGFLGNVTASQEAFITNTMWSNWFQFGQQRVGSKRAIQWAVVNGWLIPVTGTQTGSPPGSPNDVDTWNRITLDPPPSNSGDSRVDFVFLEVWLARIPPNPSTLNKPAASGLWRYGNVEGGYSFLSDDIQDPAIGFETTERIQLQYRVRVVSGVIGLATYPDGFDPTLVKARGAASTQTSFVFTNMGEELGDPGLWRAGDGTQNALGTVDGYVYAVPICAVFRRNSVAWNGDPSQNLNGGFNRNPVAVDRTGYKTFSTTATLASDISATDASLSLTSVSNIALPLTPASQVYIQIDDEILTYSVITGTTMTLVTRGAVGSKAELHKAGKTIKVLSGRPDGLYSDQIAKTDILDLRHVVNPNGFDAHTLLRANLDKLLRGELRANWKRSGGGPQGTFLFYQDKISNSPAALGVTKLDGPDNIRMVFSDASVPQPVEFILTPPVGVSTNQAITTTWGLSLTASDNNNASGLAGNFKAGDILTFPIAQFKTGIPGADADQIRFIGSDDIPDDAAESHAAILRLDGSPDFLVEGVDFSIVTTSPTPTTDMQIQLLGSSVFTGGTTQRLFVTLFVLYGPGRGLSRRPDAIHSVSFLSSASQIMTQQTGLPANNVPMRVGWAPLWSKFVSDSLNQLLPVTAESYVDPGSKTVILTPFRTIDLPDTIRTLDGSTANITTTVVTNGSGASDGSTTFTDLVANFTASGVVAGDVLIIYQATNTDAKGIYTITSAGTTTLAVAGAGIAISATDSYQIHHTQGLMPLKDKTGAPKWTTTDPLNLFRGTTYSDAPRKNIYMTLPRRMVPGWGAVHVPIIHTDTSNFDEGVNFMASAPKGSVLGSSTDRNFVPYSNGLSFAPFTTIDLNTSSTQATYNTLYTYNGNSYAGMRFFTDTRNLGRQGLELPPFYGIARLFSVYEAADYKALGSSYDDSTRAFIAGKATNLLRQNFDGPVFWIEIDADGDSTFVLNADAIDITRSPNAIANFAAGKYVVEASIFGFDRGSFSLDPRFDTGTIPLPSEFRLVMTRESGTNGSGQADDDVTRANNFGTGTKAAVATPTLILPGPATASDEVAVNYSRTPYQGDPWGSQTGFQDIGYVQGPLTSGTAAQISTTHLDENNLTRPNQKVLEVLASTGFLTTLGTGRIAGAFNEEDPLDYRSICWEDLNSWPPTSGVAPRPTIRLQGLDAKEKFVPIGTDYHGCTERLPLGSLFRDKDFRGGWVGGAGGDSDPLPNLPVALAIVQSLGNGVLGSAVSRSEALEQIQIPISTVSIASGQAGETVVHVDGEQGNYGVLTNFRTLRGGSVFSATGPRPGGEVFTTIGSSVKHKGSTALVLGGVALLVRNTVTDVGSNEVSAGSELMMLIVTTANEMTASGSGLQVVWLGTNGTAEGASAADLYHLEGRPLVRDNLGLTLDPSTITLSRRLDGII